MNLDLFTTDQLYEELSKRCICSVFAACKSADGSPDSPIYMLRGQGNMATKTGLAVMLGEFLQDCRRKEFVDEKKDGDEDDR